MTIDAPYSKLVEVALPLPFEKNLTYSLPPVLQDVVTIGSRVIVPFRKGMKTGVVVSFPQSADVENVRPIIDLADTDPPLPLHILDLCKWIAEYYCASLGETLSAAHPAGMLGESKKVVKWLHSENMDLMELEGYSEEVAEILNYICAKKTVTLKNLRKTFPQSGLLSHLTAMEKRGLIEISSAFFPSQLRPRYEILLSLNPELNEDYIETFVRAYEKKAPKKASVVRYLRNSPPITRKDLLSALGVSSGIIRSLVIKGILLVTKREIARDTAWKPLPESSHIVHTERQKNAIETIKRAFNIGGYVPFLLFGVTGSGKTEVYLEIISHCLNSGKTALVLVPEIALTPQIASRFRRKFGGQVVIMHSRISSGEKYDNWRKLAQGNARLVIGARSALFAPLKNLGLIVVDEEHEATFKQDNRPHYHARDSAVYYAKMLDIPIVLGSATPAIETFENARKGKYRLLELPERVASGKFSTFHLVDLTQEGALIPNTSISPLLLEKIEDRLAHGDKTIILQNRRGFSTFLKCKHCKATENCPNCALTLTYHITNRRLRCHICGFQKSAPTICGKCGSSDLKYCGAGTQRVEGDIEKLFPDAKLVRMDLDTTSGIDSHFRILEAFGAGKYDILLGTQMVAKGLDFPDVTLVGIISADTELLRPDFRAEERTFRLLTQAAGRSGRHRPGEVVVQTYNPEHKIFDLVRDNDYWGLYEKCTKFRRNLNYPPFGRLITLRISGTVESETALASALVADKIPHGNVRVLGPNPAIIPRLKRRYHYLILVKVLSGTVANLTEIKNSLKSARDHALKEGHSTDIAIDIDVDPQEIH
jgi:primosomal protein N' (replication factor Y)